MHSIEPVPGKKNLTGEHAEEKVAEWTFSNVGGGDEAEGTTTTPLRPTAYQET